MPLGRLSIREGVPMEITVETWRLVNMEMITSLLLSEKKYCASFALSFNDVKTYNKFQNVANDC
jgi:hypothetical protein